MTDRNDQPATAGAAASAPAGGPGPDTGTGTASTPGATPQAGATGPAASVDDVLARLRNGAGASGAAGNAGASAPAGADPSGAAPAQAGDETLESAADYGNPADYGSPEADVLAQAEAVLNDAAHTAQLEHLLAERTDDLQRLQAEYANYRKRVERDRAAARQQGAESVIRELLPIWDAISQAASHEELTGGFKVVAGEFVRLAEKLGLHTFGAVGDDFDPSQHEALMQIPSDEVAAGQVAQVIQPGYRLNDTVLRPARVAVAASPQ